MWQKFLAVGVTRTLARHFFKPPHSLLAFGSDRPLPHCVGREVERGWLFHHCEECNHPPPLRPRSGGEVGRRATLDGRVRGRFSPPTPLPERFAAPEAGVLVRSAKIAAYFTDVFLVDWAAGLTPAAAASHLTEFHGGDGA